MLVPWHRYQWRRARLAYIPAFIRCADRKHPLRIAIDLLVLTIRWRCAPTHYLRYGLYHGAHGWSAMLDHLPETVLYYRLLPRASADEILLDDKSLTKTLLDTIGVRTPHTVGVALNGDISWIEDIPNDTDLVLKPARHSSGGTGVRAVRRGELELLDGERTGEWLIERYIRSSRELALWNETSLNTLRIYTLMRPFGEALILGAVLKTGSGPGLVDNAHVGGIYIRVDLERERLIGAGVGEDMVTRRTHPRSGKTFHGALIPGSKRAAGAALAAARAVPRTPFVGWDVALDERGEAVVIEGNSSPGLTPLQRTHGGMASALSRNLKAHATGANR